MIVAKKNDEHYLTGGFWCERPPVWRDAMRKDVSEIAFEIARDKGFLRGKCENNQYGERRG